MQHTTDQTSSDALYRAFTWISASDLELISSALMSRAATLSKADGTAFSTAAIQYERDRARAIAAIARDAARPL